MNVLYFASGSMLTATIINQLNDPLSAWGFLIIPSLFMLGIAVALEYAK
jgi:hypothetical protein